MTQQAAAYRESARTGALLRLDRPLPEEQRARVVAAIAISTSIVSVAIVAVATRNPPAILMAVMAAAAASIHGVSSMRHRASLRRHVRDWLGDRARFDPRGMLVSEDGTRRVRQLPSDVDDPWRGFHCHFESLDSGGEILTSTQSIDFDLGLPGSMRPMSMREIARVSGGGGDAIAASGAPIAFVVLEHGPDGAALHRFDARGRSLGDSFHEDAAAARAEARRELSIESWREIEIGGDPWTLASRAISA